MKILATTLFSALAFTGACSERVEKKDVAPGTTLAPMPREMDNAPNKGYGANDRAADNTGVNVRDGVNDYAATADNAPMTGTDLELTAKVRQAVMGDSALSMSAQNIKIIVKDGRVTLRGPVTSAAERQRVQSIVVGLVGGNRIDNQLEIAQ